MDREVVSPTRRVRVGFQEKSEQGRGESAASTADEVETKQPGVTSHGCEGGLAVEGSPGAVLRKLHSPGDPASLRPVLPAKTILEPAQAATDPMANDPLQKQDPWRRESSYPSPEDASPAVRYQINTPPVTPPRAIPPPIHFHRPITASQGSINSQEDVNAIQRLFGDKSISVPLLLRALLGLADQSGDEARNSQPKQDVSPVGKPSQGGHPQVDNLAPDPR